LAKPMANTRILESRVLNSNKIKYKRKYNKLKKSMVGVVGVVGVGLVNLKIKHKRIKNPN